MDRLKTIIVDCELLSMSQFERACRAAADIELAGMFDNAEDALEYARRNQIDIAFMDAVLPGMSGIELGKELRKLYPDMLMIYVTAYSGYVVDILRMKADYCVLKPYGIPDVEDAMMRVRLLAKRLKKRVRVEAFGKFEVYVDEQPVIFGNKKARELFAFCIHRDGAAVTMEEVIDTLWQERPYDDKVKRLYRKAVGAVKSTFEKLGATEIFCNNRGGCYVMKRLVDCDLYKLVDEGIFPMTMKEFTEKSYMSQYSWAEERVPQLMALFVAAEEEEKRRMSHFAYEQ